MTKVASTALAAHQHPHVDGEAVPEGVDIERAWSGLLPAATLGGPDDVRSAALAAPGWSSTTAVGLPP